MFLIIAYVVAGVLLLFFVYDMFLKKKPTFRTFMIFVAGILSVAACTFILSTKLDEHLTGTLHQGQPRSVSCMFNNPVVNPKTFSDDIAKYAAMCKDDYEKKYGDSIRILPSYEYSFIDSGAYLDVTFDVIELIKDKEDKDQK